MNTTIYFSRMNLFAIKFVMVLLIVSNVFQGMELSAKSVTKKNVTSDSITLNADSSNKTTNLLKRLFSLQHFNTSQSKAVNKNDSNLNEISKLVNAIISVEVIKSKDNFLTHKEVIEQSKSFVKIYAECESANNFLKDDFDYQKSKNLKTNLIAWREMTVDGVIKNRAKLLTVRNLTTTAILLDEILKKTTYQLDEINKYHNELSNYQIRLDSLVNNSNIYKAPSDSISLRSYLQRMIFMKSNLEPVNQSIKTAIDSIQKLEIDFEILKLGLQSDIATTQNLRKNAFENMDSTEIHHLQLKDIELSYLIHSFIYSKNKALLVFGFYWLNHMMFFFIMIFCLILVMIYLKILASRCEKVDILKRVNELTIVLRYPFVTASLLTITVFQFFLPEPPIIVTSILWILCAFAVSWLIWKAKEIHNYWLQIWIVFVLIFTFTLLDDLLLRFTLIEHVFLYLNTLTVLFLSSHILFKIRKIKLVSKPMVIPFLFMNVFQILSLYYNYTGRFNTGKVLMTDGIYIFVLTFMMLWFMRLASETLNITMFFQKAINDDNHRLQDDIEAKRFPLSIYLLLVLSAGYLVMRTTYFYQSLIDPMMTAFSETRSIGKFTFTYESVFIFFMVMYLSSIVSKIISFLTVSVGIQSTNLKSEGPGSWLLLIKIAIIAGGIVLAFVAAGIPMDRLAIIISALGVGIGFGLQTLINNLVSGLIIAFEKPINVGDFVEIAGQRGKMKSIGLRSSIINTWDGADVIIPNGDLMSQHLINWTMGNSRRRYEITIGVAYGTDLEFTRQLLMQLLESDERIMKNPEPLVNIVEFNNSSIDFVIKYWLNHYDLGLTVKTDLMIAINNAFKQHNIEIPFPQQDIHIKNEGGTTEIQRTN